MRESPAFCQLLIDRTEYAGRGAGRGSAVVVARTVGDPPNSSKIARAKPNQVAPGIPCTGICRGTAVPAEFAPVTRYTMQSGRRRNDRQKLPHRPARRRASCALRRLGPRAVVDLV